MAEIIYDDETEQAVLGAMMEKDTVIPIVDNVLKPEAFYNKAHQLIYECILNVYEAEKTSDVMLVAQEVKRRQYVNRIGGLPYLYDLLTKVVDTANAEYYAQIVHENHVRRQIVRMGQSFGTLAYDQQKPIVDVVDELGQLVSKLTVKSTGDGYLPDIMLKRASEYEEAQEALRNNEPTNEMETGFYDLDEKQSASARGTMFVIGGDTGAGKSTFCRAIALHRFQHEQKVLLFTTEMGHRLMADCLFATLAQVPINVLIKIKKSMLSAEQKANIDQVRREVYRLIGWVDATGNPTIELIRAKAREIKYSKGLDCLVVDYLQNCYAQKYNDNRVMELGYIASQLDALASELDIHVIAVSQLSTTERRGRKSGDRIDEFKWAGSIKDSATCAAILRRTEIDPADTWDDYDGKPQPNKREIMELKVIKDRLGPFPCSYPVVFDKPVLTFRDADIDERRYFFKKWLDIDID